MRRWIRWAVGICACPAVAAPAGGTEQDGQQWSTVSVDHNVSPNISASLALRLRLDDDVSRKKDLTVRPAISLAGPADLKLGLGFDYLYSFPDSESSEYRPWQSIGWNQSLFGRPVANRLRLEERLFDDGDGAQFRARYRIGIRRPFANRDWYYRASNELFVNLNSQDDGSERGFDQDRAYVAIGRNLSPGLRAEFGYQLTYDEKSGENEWTHTLRVRVSILPE